MKTEIVKTTAWLTRRYTEEELAKMKEEALKEVEVELQKKQIEEMVKDLDAIYSTDFKGDYNSGLRDIAERLYNAGYRKQKEGEWVDADPNGSLYRFTCSLCRKTKLGKGTPYCPNCGAHMRGGKNE